MDFELSEDQEAIRQMALDFAAKEIAPKAIEWDQTKTLPIDVLRDAAGLGMGAGYGRRLCQRRSRRHRARPA